MKASIGSEEYITSLFTSDDESSKIREAFSTSSYGGDFVRAALSVNNKVVKSQQFVNIINHFRVKGSSVFKILSCIFLSSFLIVPERLSLYLH